MARNQEALSIDGNWTQLTNGAVTDITFQVLAGKVEIRYTTDTTPPSTSDRGFVYDRDEGELDRPLTELTNLVGAARVWAKAVKPFSTVIVDHA